MEHTCTADLSGALTPGDAPAANLVYLNRSLAIKYEHLLSPQECERIIAATEALGYGKTLYDTAYRGNLRLMCDDRAMAAALWQRIHPAMADVTVRHNDRLWRPVGLNPRFRYAKYPPGARFERHLDSFYEDVWTGARSFYTVNIYLNAVAGATRFDNGYDCECVPGAALLFMQAPVAQLWHEGLPAGGVKYLMRTDVMFM